MKLSVLAVAGVLSLMSLIQTDDYAYAKSSLMGEVQQVVVAPQDGFIETAGVRAGDKVSKGQMLVGFNQRDLKLEEQRLSSERDKLGREYREALALRERAKVSILSAQIDQVKAQLGLVNQKLERSRLKAPFEGVVVWGDLSQSLGAPVQKGEKLFELSPLGDYRVVLNVDDHDISKFELGQEGSLRLMGLPYDQFKIKVSRITPVAVAKEGGNYFYVEAAIEDMNDTRLRPGMQGVAKVKMGQESVLWSWSRTLMERLRLWLWSIGV